jgi:D-alanine-D-alanine ligase
MGGPDAEREVSLASGGRVVAALETFDDLTVVARPVDAPEESGLRAMFESDGADVIFPVLHGAWGEGGALQSRLERIGTPFVGSGRAAAELAMDKMRSKAMVAELAIPTPAAEPVSPGREIGIPLPLVLKPIADGSSVGVRMASTPEELAEVRPALEADHDRLMAESFVRGRELTVGMVDGAMLPPIEIIPSTGFYDYEAKYLRDDTRYVVSPDLPSGVEEDLETWSRRILDAFEVRDFGRVDWLLPSEGPSGPRPTFLEVNTIPGMTDHSLIPMGAERIGFPMPKLCRRLIEAALDRG